MRYAVHIGSETQASGDRGKPRKGLPTDSPFAIDVDVRLHATLLWALGEAELNEAMLAAFLRLAYVTGYHDALVEPIRGQLFLDHRVAVPERASATE